MFGIQEGESQHRRVLRVALLQCPQFFGEARSRQTGDAQSTDYLIVIGGDLLVDLDAFAFDGDPVVARLGELLHRRLDCLYLLWPDQCGTVFDQGDHAVDALADGVAGWDFRNRIALTLV